MKPIYLDYNASTPVDPEVITAMKPYLEEHYGNPSSSHWYGQKTHEAVEKAREQTASLLNCKSSEIVFTSGGTESNNYAIKGFAFANQDKGNHIITAQIEHPAVIEVCKFLEAHGFEITYLPVNEFGLVEISDVEKAIKSQTILISIMHANNEVGAIQPIEEISALARKNRVIVHTDAAQSVGKIPADVKVLGVDLLSVAGHKLYAPKGIGALCIKEGVPLEKLIHGAAGHEQGKRAGTENVIGIVGLGKACEIAKRDLNENILHMKRMKDKLYNELQEKLKVGVQNFEPLLNGHPEKCLPNTLSLSFKGLDVWHFLSTVKDKLAVSAGSACHSSGSGISSVLKAMNVPLEWAKGTIRFSTGKMTTEEEIEQTIKIVMAGVQNGKIS